MADMVANEDVAEVDHRAAFWWLTLPCQRQREADDICEDHCVDIAVAIADDGGATRYHSTNSLMLDHRWLLGCMSKPAAGTFLNAHMPIGHGQRPQEVL